MTLFDDLIANTHGIRSYLVVIEPYDPDLSAVTVLRFSDRGFTTGPSDSPANSYFAPRLVTPLNFQRELFSSGQIGGRSIPRFGVLALNNADGGLDDMARLSYDGRRVRVYLGGVDFRLSDYGLIFDGTAEQIEFDDELVRVQLRDLQSKLDIDVVRGSYGGAGGLDGRSGLEGQVKPLTFGRVFRIEPVLVDPSQLIYQVHDGPISDVAMVHDNGVELTKVGSAPVAGQFTVDTAAGTFQLGAGAAGTVTADVHGEADGGVLIETVAGLVRRIVGTRTEILDPDDIDTDAFDAFDAICPVPVGVFVPDETSTLDLLDRVVESVGAHFGFNRSGKLTIGRIAAPVAPEVSSYCDREILELERVAVARPAWRRKIGYARYWTTLDADAVAGSVGEETRADWAEEYRYAVQEDASIQARHLLSEEVVDETGIAFKADAEAEATRRLTVFGADRDAFRVTLKTQPFALELGQTVRIAYPRYGLDSGRLLIVVGMTEDASINQVTLDLWG